MKWMISPSNSRRGARRNSMLAWGRALSHPITAARNFTGRFARDERGAVIILVAFVVVVLCLIGGVAIDSARGYLLKSRLSGALDAAGLAGARVMHLTPTERDADINAYFNANFPPGFMSATMQPLTITTDADNKILTLTANASVGTTLMRVIGHDNMAVAARTVIRRETTGLEVVMVLDNTYSMNGSKIADLRTAATDLVNILYGSEETIPNLWVGLVPFVHSVNVGNTHADWLVQGDPAVTPYPHVNTTACNANPTNVAICEQKLTTPVTHWSGGPPDPSLYYYHPSLYAGGGSFGPASPPLNWKGCVEARIRPDDGSDINDDPPSVRAFRPYYYPESRVRSSSFSSTQRDNRWWPTSSGDGNTGGGRGPNIGCAGEIQPLSASKTGITDAINAMTVWQYGGTAIKLGMAWGWRAISPRWKGLWGGDPTLPKDYTEPLMEKAIILLTDGEHFFWDQGSHPDEGYNSHGRLDWGRLHNASGNVITSSSAGVNELDRRLGLLCTNIKATGITIYTIMLELTSSSVQNLFRDCASKPEYFFNAPSSSDLSEIFQAIANDLATLRIAE